MRGLFAVRSLLLILPLAGVLRGQEATVVEQEGRVVVTKFGSKPVPAAVGTGLVARDKLGTGEASRAVLKMSEKWFARVDEETDIEITPGALGAGNKDALKLALGGAFIYSREQEGELRVQTPSATGGLRGTQLMVRVWPDGKTLMQVLEGEVDLANDSGAVLLKAGEAGEAEPGQAPHKTAVIETRNLLQWALYYPAVLQPDELGLTGGERQVLASSLEAYRQGALLEALNLYPGDVVSSSDGARLYHAAVLLATGQVQAAREAVRDVSADHPGRRALERMLAAVLASEVSGPDETRTASGALAESYYQQSRRNLEAARAAARRATELASTSGFTWIRLAELEFSFGRTREARAALEKGLKLSPRNAQAHALRGYLLSAENRIDAARESFQKAVELDGGLGNAWLGLGLTKIKQGRLAEGRSDLQTAATVEPTRSFFLSYHGKALSMVGDPRLARKDLERAKQLDPQDPTPWLYSAIQTQQENRYNDAIGDVQESVRLNDNRRVYRSQFLLDQDSAVRSSNLARIYQNNGMTDLAVREATRAVDSDYVNASAHLFLANSFAALRDPHRILLRYETAWFNEQLLANLLAPVGGGPLSQFVSQQEYSKLLAADGGGGTVVVESRERGYKDIQGSLYETHGRLSTGLDYAYHHDAGTRPDNDDTRKEAYGHFKYQIGADDVFYALIKWQNEKSGDLLQNYDNRPGNAGLRFEEKQTPGLLLASWNHRWSPGVHTLFLGGRLAAEQTLTAPMTDQLILQRNPAYLQPDFLRPAANGGLEYTSATLRNATVPPVSLNPDGSQKVSADLQSTIAPFLGAGPVIGVYSDKFDFFTQRKWEIYSGEILQIWQSSRQTVLIGGRWQGGPFDTKARLDLRDPAVASFFTSPAALQDVSVDFERRSVYAYDFLTVVPGLTLVAGGSRDLLTHPDNFRNPPVNERQAKTARTSGKFGFTLSPAPWFTMRGVYLEALGGVTFDESVRLEPVQLAGFNQAFRTVVSESIAGSVEAPVYRNRGLSIEGALPTRAWWSASFNILTEDVQRTVGAFDLLTVPELPSGLPILPAGTTEALAYREEVFTAGVNQLIGSEFAVGAGYRHTRSELHYRATQIPVTLAASAERFDVAALHEVTLNANWNSPAGWLARTEANWYAQDLDGTIGGQPAANAPGDKFWQINVEAGFRFRRNQREVTVGVLNLTGRDYRLSPLSSTPELPRARTLFVRCRVSF